MGEREDRAIGLPEGTSADRISSRVFYAYWRRYVHLRDGWAPADIQSWAIETYQALKENESKAMRAALTQEQAHPRRGRPLKPQQ